MIWPRGGNDSMSLAFHVARWSACSTVSAAAFAWCSPIRRRLLALACEPQEVGELGPHLGEGGVLLLEDERVRGDIDARPDRDVQRLGHEEHRLEITRSQGLEDQPERLLLFRRERLSRHRRPSCR